MMGSDKPKIKTMAPRPVAELLDRLFKFSEESVEDFTEEKKSVFHMNPMREALFSVLSDVKEKTEISTMKMVEKQEDTEIEKLDKMLTNEGVTSAPSVPTSSKDDQAEYQQQLDLIRVDYSTNMQNYEQKKTEFTQTLIQLLKGHIQVRPISNKDIDGMVAIIRKKFDIVQVQIKQGVCQKIIEMKNRFCDARRKRRNFTKEATEILNDYFFSHLDNPYPPEEVKEQLARQCDISVSQVSNWFGNKRIRYKKLIARNPEEAHMQSRRPTTSLAPSAPMPPVSMMNPASYGMFPYPQAQMFNPYSGMIPGQDLGNMGMPPGFDLSMYNSQLMGYPNTSQSMMYNQMPQMPGAERTNAEPKPQ